MAWHIRAISSVVILLTTAACGVRSVIPGAPVSEGDAGGSEVVVLPETLPHGRARADYQVVLSARGGVGAPYVFDHVEGQLPRGLTLLEDGTLAGTAMVPGTSTFDVTATDAAGNVGARTYTLEIEGPRWVAYTEFISTTTPRGSLSLLDYTAADSTPHLIVDGNGVGASFSPDGHWLSYYDFVAPGVDAFVVDVSGARPSAPVALTDVGQVISGAMIAWSPDAKHVAYGRVVGGARSLWSVDVSTSGLGTRRMIADDVAQHGLAWPHDGVLVFRDASSRMNVVRFAGDTNTRTTFDLLDANVAEVAPDGSVALLTTATGSYLGDGVTGEITELLGFDIWGAPDDLAVVMGVAVDGTFALYRVAGATLGPVLFDGAPLGSLSLPVWAQGQSAVSLVRDDGHLFVYRYGAFPQTFFIPGTYGPARSAVFARSWATLVFTDDAAAWLGFAKDDLPIFAVTLADFGSRPEISIAPNVDRVLASAGSPVSARVIDFEAYPYVEHDVSLGLTWMEGVWSSDAAYLGIVGAEPGVGRVFYVTAIDAIADARLVSSCSGPTSTPRCPNLVRFQP